MDESENTPTAEAQPAVSAPVRMAVKQVKSRGELLRFATPPAKDAAPAAAADDAADTADAEPAAEAPVAVASPAAVSEPPGAPPGQTPRAPVVTGKGELLRFAAPPPAGDQGSGAGPAAAPLPRTLVVVDEKPQPKKVALPEHGEKAPPPSLAEKLPKRIKVAAPTDPIDAAIGHRPARGRAGERERESGRTPVSRGAKLKRRMHAAEQSSKATRMVVGMAVAGFLAVAVGVVMVVYAKRKPVAEVDLLAVVTQPGPDETEAIPLETRQAIWKAAWANEARATRDAEAQYPVNAQDGLKDTREQGLKRQRYKERRESSYNYETAKKYSIASHIVDAIVQAGLRKGWKVPTEDELRTAAAVAADKSDAAASETAASAAATTGPDAAAAPSATVR